MKMLLKLMKGYGILIEIKSRKVVQPLNPRKIKWNREIATEIPLSGGKKIRVVPLGQNHKQKRKIRKKKAVMAQFPIMKKKIRKMRMMKQRKLKKNRRMVVKVNLVNLKR